jgi:molybdopterin-guanine dinucleotide biosynthesis protein A
MQAARPHRRKHRPPAAAWTTPIRTDVDAAISQTKETASVVADRGRDRRDEVLIRSADMPAVTRMSLTDTCAAGGQEPCCTWSMKASHR